ncbi:iron chelate uptake ABC transporter family permease subunit [Streptomyces albidoflavus]|uniref:FecCD family ABC transporter permease n=1 Tax=Streptomyces albidoflavus TaxID=1886 RepID=UPI0033A66A00
MRTEPPRTALLSGVLVLVLAAAVASLAVGTRTVPPAEVWRALTDAPPGDGTTLAHHLVIREVRLPRTIIGVLAGAALAVSGALMQTLTRNALAEPGVLGVTGGAGFAVTLGAVAGLAGSQAAQLGLATLGALLAALLVYAVGRASPLRLVLAGTALGFVLAGFSLALRMTLPDVFDTYRFWVVGSLAGREQVPYLLPLLVIVAGLAGALLAARPLQALGLGTEVARTLGSRVRRTRITVLVLITVLAGAATALAGPIAFLGLMVPHLARRLAGGSVRLLLGLCIVLGPLVLLTADVAARLLLPTGEVPVAVVTAFLGGPVLIWAVRRYGAVTL